MRIFMVPGTSDCANMGDVAMLQTAISRLRELWPGAALRILTHQPAQLKGRCRDAADAIHVPWQGMEDWHRLKTLPRPLLPETNGAHNGLAAALRTMAEAPRVFRPRKI